MKESGDEYLEALADTLWQLWKLWSERSHTPEKLSAEQYWVLRTLERESPMTVSELAQRRGVTTAAMTIGTTRMEAAGWLLRVRRRRHVMVELTESGEDVWLRASTERRRVLRMLPWANDSRGAGSVVQSGA